MKKNKPRIVFPGFICVKTERLTFQPFVQIGFKFRRIVAEEQSCQRFVVKGSRLNALHNFLMRAVLHQLHVFFHNMVRIRQLQETFGQQVVFQRSDRKQRP